MIIMGRSFLNKETVMSRLWLIVPALAMATCASANVVALQQISDNTVPISVKGDAGLHLQISAPLYRPLMRHNPDVVYELMDQIDRGDVQVQRQYGPPGAAFGLVVGFGAGGGGYLLAHGLNDFQGANLAGFMMASLGGAFQGAVSGGSGSYMIFFASTALQLALGFGTAWMDSLYQEMEQVGGQ